MRRAPPAATPDVTIGTDAATWLRLREGELSGLEAFSERRLYARGDLDLAVGFEGLFRLPNGRAAALRIHDVRVRAAAHLDADDGRGTARAARSTASGGTKASFFDTAAALSRRYRVHALDLPGFGSSSKPATAPYNAAWFARRSCQRHGRARRSSARTWSATRWAAGWRWRSRLRRPERVGALGACCARRVAFVERGFTRSSACCGPSSAAPPPLHARHGRRAVLGPVRRPRPRRPAASPTSWSTSSSASTAPPARAGVPAPRPATSTSTSRSAQTASTRAWPSSSRPALFVWGSHDKLIPAGFSRHVARWLPRRRADRPGRLRPRAPGRAPRADDGPLQRFFGGVPTRWAPRGAAARRRPRSAPMTHGMSQLARSPTRRSAQRPPRGRCREARAGLGRAAAGRAWPAPGPAPHPRRRPRRARPRLHPREPAAACGCSPACGSGARCAGWATSPRRGRCCWWATTRAATSTPDTQRLHARLQHLLRRRAALLPAGPQPRALDARASASCASTARSPPRRRTPRRRCRSGAALLVYPGGDYEVHRPTLGAPHGRLRRPQGLHPPGARAGRADRAGGVDRRPGDGAVPHAAARGWRALLRPRPLFRLKVLPISLALPWGLNVGDMLGHIPLPAKITVEVLPPIHLREEFGADPDLDEVYDHVMRADAGDPRRAGRRAPPAGARMRVDAQHRRRRAARSAVWELRLRPGALPALHVGRDPLGGRRATQPSGHRRPLPDAACAWARPRSAA